MVRENKNRKQLQNTTKNRSREVSTDEHYLVSERSAFYFVEAFGTRDKFIVIPTLKLQTHTEGLVLLLFSIRQSTRTCKFIHTLDIIITFIFF